MDFLDFLIVGAVIGILVGTFQAIEKSQKKSKLKTKITYTCFSTKQRAVSEDGSTALGVDEKNKKIFIESVRRRIMTQSRILTETSYPLNYL
jgi:hypothetical protein